MSGGPRNRKAYERGQRARARVRELMSAHAARYPFSPLPGWKLREILRHEGIELALSTVLWHVAQIRLESEMAALTVDGTGDKACNRSNSSAAEPLRS